MIRRVFVTGATGFLGRRFVRALVDRGHSSLMVLVRSRNGKCARDRAESLGLDFPGVEVVEGDIADSSILADLLHLPPPVEFWHIAGLTEFHESKREQLERVNVDGTRHALELAKRWNVRRFFHISTAYVAGASKGKVLEDELVPDPVFRNPYEETKYRAEQLVRASGVPWIVIRPSILVGDSLTGEADSDKMVYGVCRIYHALSKWVRRETNNDSQDRERRYYVRARSEAAKNCLCIDDAIRLMIAIQTDGQVGKTYHCCHPKATTMGALHEAGVKATRAPFLWLNADKVDGADRKQKFVERGLHVYEPYMLGSDPDFELANTRAVAPYFEPARMSEDRLLHLFKVYVNVLTQREAVETQTSLDLSRLRYVKRYGTTTLAYNSMSRQFQAFTSPGIDGYLAYALRDHLALIVGDPVAENPSALLGNFVNWCARENREICAVQIGHATAHVLRALGCHVNKLGIETFVDLRQLDPEFRGGRYAKTRNHFIRARRAGVRVREVQIGECRERLASLFSAWLDRKKNREELRLLLRPPSLEAEPDVRYFLAELGDRIVGSVFFTPIYRNELIIGYLCDIERYHAPENSALPRNVNLMRLVELEAAQLFRREGCETLALGMSPLFEVAESEFNDNPALTQLCQQLFDESTLYAFRGIAAHKRAYPCRVEQPVYIATSEPTAAEGVFALLKCVGLLG